MQMCCKLLDVTNVLHGLVMIQRPSKNLSHQQPPPHQLEVWWSTVSSTAGFGAEPLTDQRFSTIFSTQDGLSWHYNIANCGLSCSNWGGGKTRWAPCITLSSVTLTATLHFHDFPGPTPDSRTFQAWKMWLLNSRTFHDLYKRTLWNCLTCVAWRRGFWAVCHAP